MAVREAETLVAGLQPERSDRTHSSHSLTMSNVDFRLMLTQADSNWTDLQSLILPSRSVSTVKMFAGIFYSAPETWYDVIRTFYDLLMAFKKYQDPLTTTSIP